MFISVRFAILTVDSVVRSSFLPLRLDLFPKIAPSDLWLKALVHHAAPTAYHKDSLAKAAAEGTHAPPRSYPVNLAPPSQPCSVHSGVSNMPACSSAPLDRIGVGIDTARYGHRVAFLRPDRQPAAKPLTVLENQAGYQALQQRLEHLHQQHPQAHFHVRIDAAGQYAANLEHFLRGLPLPITLSIGEPKRNKDYQKAHFPKRTTDDTESQAMARFAVVELPEATLPVPPQMALLREVATRLQAQVKQSTQAVNRLHNLMARVFPELATLADDFSARWLLTLLDRYPTAQRLGAAQLRSVEQIPHLPANTGPTLAPGRQDIRRLPARPCRRDAGRRISDTGMSLPGSRGQTAPAPPRRFHRSAPVRPCPGPHHPGHRPGHRRRPGRQGHRHRPLCQPRAPGRLFWCFPRGKQLRR